MDSYAADPQNSTIDAIGVVHEHTQLPITHLTTY